MALSTLQRVSSRNAARDTVRVPVRGVPCVMRHSPRLGGLTQSAEGEPFGSIVEELLFSTV